MTADQPSSATLTFRDLQLPAALLQALDAVGYESPSPIQAETIPQLLAGRDVLGQAQTGTGKTAAFALPTLARLDIGQRAVQALVLTPTRELAIQVAEAFQRYAAHLQGFHVLPIYGGQSYDPQLSALRRGVHVVVGTPGRVLDHIKRGTLKFEQLRCVVLDEADEMLRMGFIEDVEWILQQTPAGRQVALFSATMPPQVRRIAQNHLRSPAEVTIRSKTATAANIRQRYWLVSGLHKLDALTRILEAESFDAMIIFARTKLGTEELTERLEARGFAAAALNGDVPQQQRERTVQRLRDGHLDILVATDVAARGLNVERISHVVNFDIPLDIESYVHRIGRTGRAGRSGEAVLFVTPRERRMLAAIERATRQPIERMELPTVEAVNDQRVVKFKARIAATLAAGELEVFRDVVEQYEQEHNVPAIEIAAALARLAQGKTPLLLDMPARARAEPRAAVPEPLSARRSEEPRRKPPEEPRPHRAEHSRESLAVDTAPLQAPRPRRGRSATDMDTYRLAVGRQHEVKPGNIVGAIANEAGLDAKYIGRIEIFDDYSLIDLPAGMPKEILRHLKKVWVAGQMLRITPHEASAPAAPRRQDSTRTSRPERRVRPAAPGQKPKRKKIRSY